MVKIRNFRHPIHCEINGKSVTFVTIGHCARIMGRTTACVKHWEAIGLFPPAAYRLAKGQLRLYPQDFLRSLGQLDLAYLGRRMDRSDWRRFQIAV
jgi:hypothetical protein